MSIDRATQIENQLAELYAWAKWSSDEIESAKSHIRRGGHTGTRDGSWVGVYALAARILEMEAMARQERAKLKPIGVMDAELKLIREHVKKADEAAQRSRDFAQGTISMRPDQSREDRLVEEIKELRAGLSHLAYAVGTIVNVNWHEED
jgi:hypothetical protein